MKVFTPYDFIHSLTLEVLDRSSLMLAFAFLVVPLEPLLICLVGCRVTRHLASMFVRAQFGLEARLVSVSMSAGLDFALFAGGWWLHEHQGVALGDDATASAVTAYALWRGVFYVIGAATQCLDQYTFLKKEEETSQTAQHP